MNDLVKLSEVVYDVRARDGIWCKLSYPNHPKGCPNFPACPLKHPDFKTVSDAYTWFAVVEEFDLKAHAEAMKLKHPEWSERQCRNLLYWQNGVRKRLFEKALHFRHIGDIILTLTVPEACGVNVYETMAKVGIVIQRNPDTVKKVMFLGISHVKGEFG